MQSVPAVLLIGGVVAAATAHSLAASQPPDEGESAQAPVSEAESKPGPSRFSLDLKLRYESDYFFRGIVQRSDALNFQPSATLTFDLLRDQLFTVSLVGGIWNNLSDDLAPGGTGDLGEHWYELDAFTALSLGYDRWSLSGIYTWYYSPASDWDEYEDITFTLGFSDGGLWDDGARFSLNPWISLAVETDHAADGLDSGVWLGLGLTPTYDVGPTLLGPMTVATPFGVGLSLDDYYQRADGTDESFGYFEVGLVAAFDLTGKLGWAAPTLEVGAKYLRLGDVTEEYNGGDSDEIVVSVGLGWSF